jgi:hypothetical protein
MKKIRGAPTNPERETAINFDDGGIDAWVYTCNRAWIARPDKLCESSPAIAAVREDEFSKTYKFPKSWAKIRKLRELTEESMQKLKSLGDALGHWRREGAAPARDARGESGAAP